jgi:hypothetical protein
MSRAFGVEIEFTGLSAERATRAIESAGVTCADRSYTHNAHETRSWKIVWDGSLDHGFEAVSPILRGQAGLAELETVTKALAMEGASVNRQCGLHVHIDARDLTPEQVRSVVVAYGENEDVFDAIMPQSRRGDAGRWCKSLQRALPALRRATTMTALRSALNGDRYHKVNLESHPIHGTIEFRHHSGSVNWRKILNWVRLLNALVQNAVTGERGLQVLDAAEIALSNMGGVGHYKAIAEEIVSSGMWATRAQVPGRTVSCSLSKAIAEGDPRFRRVARGTYALVGATEVNGLEAKAAKLLRGVDADVRGYYVRRMRRMTTEARPSAVRPPARW